mgnify:CR=1 FL=1
MCYYISKYNVLSFRLLELGHSVAIIDKEENAFQILGDDFTGQKVLGIGFDRDTLIEAGSELHTDEYNAYKFTRKFWKHKSVNHSV